MKKEKVYIVVSHKHILKTPGSKTREPQWEVAETVEFVNQLRNKHLTTSSAIGDYINRKMEKGERHGMGDYNKFEEYVRSKYAKELAQLDAAYRADQVAAEEVASPEVFADEFGNLRARTVFDKATA
jgi:hypothetical protein